MAVMHGVFVTPFTYNFPKSFFNSTLPSIVFCQSKAIIDNCYLSWLDVGKLQAAFPSRVQILDDTVTLTGPVTIVSHNIGPLQRIYMQSTVAFVAVLFTFAATHFFIRIFPEPESQKRLTGADDKSWLKIITVAAVHLAVFVGVYYAVGRLIPTQAGVYFNKEIPFYA
jgi:hypothetical protein